MKRRLRPDDLKRWRARLLATIHAGATAIGMEEAARRDMMERVTGQRSAAKMSIDQLKAVADELRRLGFVRLPNSTFEKIRSELVIPEGGKPQALLIEALWHALTKRPGATRHGEFARLDTFMKRMEIGVSHPNFATPAQCNKIIEALKAWHDREDRKASAGKQGPDV